MLEVENLVVEYPGRGGTSGRGGAPGKGGLRAVDGVSFALAPGETLGLAGESGCGKSSLARAIMGLVPAGGRVLWNGADILPLCAAKRRPYARDIQMIFQNVRGSLNPQKRVLELVAEPLRNFETLSGAEEKRRVLALLEKTGLEQGCATKYPSALSGGQRQRVVIARALALNPKLIIADEPVSSLDGTVQAQVLAHMRAIQEEFGLSYLFISHDLRVVYHMCRRLMVMQAGHIIESGPVEDVFAAPAQGYTRRLVEAIPRLPAPGEEGAR